MLGLRWKKTFQRQELKDSGWSFDKFISMTIHFYKTGDMNGSSYVKILFRSFATLNIQYDNKNCFL